MSRILTLSAKCADLCSGEISGYGEPIRFEGEVPAGFGIGGGDYVRLRIDLDTGTIVGFSPPSDADLNDLRKT